MGFWARIKTFGGGRTPLPIIASATTLKVPDETNGAYVSGSTTITSLICSAENRTRKFTFVGYTSASVTFTHSSGSTTQHQMDIGGSDITLAAGDILELFCNEIGVWKLVNYQPNSSQSQSVASATTTVISPSASIVTLTGTESITTLTGGTPSEARRVSFIGGAGAVVTFTNTNVPSAGQMYLHGQNRTIQEDDVAEFILKTDGSWVLVNIAN